MNLSEHENQILLSDIPERFYEELYSKADILYFRLDENFQIISCNVTAEDKLITNKEILIQTSFITFLSDSCQNDTLKALQLCIQKGYIREIEIRMRTQNDETIHGLMNGLTYEGEDGSRFLRIYIQDVTYNQQLNLTNRILSTLLQAQQNQPEDMELFYQSFAKLLDCDGSGLTLRLKDGESIIAGYWEGVRTKEELGPKDFRRWHPQIWRMMVQKCRKAEAGKWTENGSFWTGYLKETISVLQDGEKHAFESLSAYESLALISLDVPDQYQGYLILLDRKPTRWDEHLIQVLENVSQEFARLSIGYSDIKPVEAEHEIIHPWMNVPVIGVLMTENGIIRHANPWIETHVGIPAEKMNGSSVKEILSQESCKILDSIESGSLMTGQFKNMGIIAFRTYNGSYKRVECVITSMPILNKNYELWYWLDHKEDSDLLLQLQQSRKMEALGILTGGIVHDFDNILSTIVGFTALLREEIGNNSPLSNDVKQISDTAEKAVQLTSRLLAYAHGKSYIVESLNVNQLVNEVAGILSRTLDKNILIRADLEKALYTITADASQIQQVILQVAINAKEAMPHGGSLVFQTRNMILNDEDPRLKKGCQAGNYIQIVLSDTGLGMSSQIKDQIFEPHFSTKNQTPGKGLGLTMVRQIIEQNGGFVSVFSEIGKGTVFKIHIPANATHINKPKERKIKTEDELEAILVVDDERLVRDTAKRMLIRYGYHVLMAGSSQEAIAIHKKYQDKITLIILDLMMPGSDTGKTIDSFKTINSKVKILILLKSEERKKIRPEINQHCVGVIQKPLQIAGLLKKVQTTLQH